jgi:hypothetical protein
VGALTARRPPPSARVLDPGRQSTPLSTPIANGRSPPIAAATSPAAARLRGSAERSLHRSIPWLSAPRPRGPEAGFGIERSSLTRREIVCGYGPRDLASDEAVLQPAEIRPDWAGRFLLKYG